MQWQYIVKELHADITVLDLPLLDTRNKDGDLTGTLIADLVLQLLAYVAQQERDFIRMRQAEGIAAAKAKGKRFGRPLSQMPENYDAVAILCLSGNISLREGAKRLGISYSTLQRRISRP